MNVLLVWAVVSVLALAAAPNASGHGPEADTISKSGLLELGPAGSYNESFHALFSSMGLPMHSGETLRFSWRVNDGNGPPVFFDIHAHGGDSQWESFYSRTAVEDSGEWEVPGSDQYMVFWQNPNDVGVDLSYEFELFPESTAQGTAPLDYFPLVLLAVAGGIFGLLMLQGIRKRPEASEESEE